jgi:Domain of unknown function (DUF4432)
MPSFILTDVAHDLWVEDFAITPADLGLSATHPWSVTKRVLHGGRREGVELIVVNNGVLSFSIIPTRGMGLWRGQFRGDRIGWDSPVTDGPVNPSFVNLMSTGGLGWLEGFDELLARAGLECNGAPYEVKTVNPDGSASHTIYGLHGKIANIPARYVAIHVGEDPPHEITVEGHVDEARLFAPHIRMITRISTTPGSNRVTVRDEFVNLQETPSELEILYHWNFGPPFLEEGSRFIAPIQTLVPRNKNAQEAIGHYDVYGGPEPGVSEQVFFLELHAGRDDGRTLAMLRNHAGDKGVVLRFATAQLPVFSLWKRTGGRREGYVTGLEPGTNYPNPRPFEKAHNRVVSLPEGGSHMAEMTLEIVDTKPGVAAIEAEVNALQAQAAPRVHKKPVEPFAAEESQ